MNSMGSRRTARIAKVVRTPSRMSLGLLREACTAFLEQRAIYPSDRVEQDVDRVSEGKSSLIDRYCGHNQEVVHKDIKLRRGLNRRGREN